MTSYLSNDKTQKCNKRKIFLTGIFFVLIMIRFLEFYEIEGIRVQNGWATIAHHKLAFLIAVIMFCAGVWMRKMNGMICLFMQIIPFGIILYCEYSYLSFNDYTLAYAEIGFWLNIIVSLIIILGCIGVSLKKQNNTWIEDICN